MSYFDRQRRKVLYELKLLSIVKKDALHKDGCKSFRKGQKVSYNDDEYIVKFCEGDNCVIENKSGIQEFVLCSKVRLVGDGKLNENIYQVTYSTDGVNYHSNVLVVADNEDEAKERAISSAKVKPHADSQIIVTKRDLAFVDDYHNKRGMKLIESRYNPALGKDAVKAVKRILEVGILLCSMENHPITKHELDTLIDNLIDLRDSIDKSDDYLNEDFQGDDMPDVPITPEDNGTYTLLNSLITDEIEAIDGYNGAIQTILSLEKIDSIIKEGIVKVLTDIAGEENIHIGQLLRILQLVNPLATLIKDGEEEAQETIDSGI